MLDFLFFVLFGDFVESLIHQLFNCGEASLELA